MKTGVGQNYIKAAVSHSMALEMHRYGRMIHDNDDTTPEGKQNAEEKEASAAVNDIKSKLNLANAVRNNIFFSTSSE